MSLSLFVTLQDIVKQGMTTTGRLIFVYLFCCNTVYLSSCWKLCTLVTVIYRHFWLVNIHYH